MKKPCIILSIALCLSLLGGCSADVTLHDESDCSMPHSDVVESLTDDLLSDTTTTTIAVTDAENSADDADISSTTTATTTTSQRKTNKTTTKTSFISKSPSNATTPTTTTAATATTTTSTTSTMASTTAPPSTTKKDHGTPDFTGIFRDDMAEAVLTMLNNARKNAGLNELAMDEGNMMTAAKIRAKEITTCWDHKRPDGDNWNTVFDEEEVKYNARGENLACGHTSAQMVFDAWMASKDHKENMLTSYYTHVSIVCLEYNDQFYWVQLFGANITH